MLTLLLRESVWHLTQETKEAQEAQETQETHETHETQKNPWNPRDPKDPWNPKITWDPWDTGDPKDPWDPTLQTNNLPSFLKDISRESDNPSPGQPHLKISCFMDIPQPPSLNWYNLKTGLVSVGRFIQGQERWGFCSDETCAGGMIGWLICKVVNQNKSKNYNLMKVMHVKLLAPA